MLNISITYRPRTGLPVTYDLYQVSRVPCVGEFIPFADVGPLYRVVRLVHRQARDELKTWANVECVEDES